MQIRKGKVDEKQDDDQRHASADADIRQACWYRLKLRAGIGGTMACRAETTSITRISDDSGWMQFTQRGQKISSLAMELWS
jgi:hypothetical protein